MNKYKNHAFLERESAYTAGRTAKQVKKNEEAARIQEICAKHRQEYYDKVTGPNATFYSTFDYYISKSENLPFNIDDFAYWIEGGDCF